MADCRSAVRCSSQAGSPMCTQCPSSRWSVTSQRPRPRATTWGRCRAIRNGQSAAPVVAARRRRPGRARRQHLELGVEVAADGGVVGHADAVLLLGLHRQPHAERHGDGVAEDQQPHRVRARRHRSAPSAACSDVRQSGREGDGHPGAAGRVGPGHRRRRRRCGGAGRAAAAGQQEAGGARPGPAHPNASRRTVLLAAARPRRAGGIADRSSRAGEPGRVPDSPRRPIRPALSIASEALSGACMRRGRRTARPASVATQTCPQPPSAGVRRSANRVPDRSMQRLGAGRAARRSRPRPPPAWWAADPARPS